MIRLNYKYFMLKFDKYKENIILKATEHSRRIFGEKNAYW